MANNKKIGSENQVKNELTNQPEVNSNTHKTNCFILTGLKKTPPKIIVGMDAIWDCDLAMWCFFKKETAEHIAEKFKKSNSKIKVIGISSKLVTEWFSGSKSRKKLIKKRSLIAFKKNQLKMKEDHFDIMCHKDKMDKSFLLDPPPEDWEEKNKKTHALLSQKYEDLLKEKDEILTLEKECNSLEEIAIQEESHPSINFDNWPFKILGYNNKREILLWHKGSIMPILAKQISEADIKLLLGIEVPCCDKVKDAIIDRAHCAGKIYDENPVKAGVWLIKNKWLVISGQRAAVVENGLLSELKDPVFEGKIIEHSSADWLDWNAFKDSFENPDLSKTFSSVLTKVSAWNWLYADMAEYATAFIFLTPLQHGMSWRPWLYLTGSKGTGKTSFFEHILHESYGNLVERLDKSTAHAVAQTLGNSNRIPVFDEFEKHRHIGDVLELAKLFNKGGKKTSGTPGSTANSYDLHHMAWFGSIYLPQQLNQDAAQESRMIKLELRKLKSGTPILDKIDHSTITAGHIVGAMIKLWDFIEKGAQDINRARSDILSRIPGIEIRTVENFMYASSLLNLIQKEKKDIPEWAVQRVEEDSDRIIGTILSSLIRIDHEDHSVADCLYRSKGDQALLYTKALENCGIKHSCRLTKPFIAFRSEIVTRHLLKDTAYRDLDIQAPLSRIEGAISSHPVKFNGKQERCVLIPRDHILGIENDELDEECNPSVTLV